MEWSDRDDAWADEPEGQRADGAAGAQSYPPAPVPAHERPWRHPSEMGQYATQAWAVAEPPVALGRGLLVTTGMVGCALGVAILWLLVPAGGDAPSADVAGPNRPAASATRPTQPDSADRDTGTTGTASTIGSTFASLAPTTVHPVTTAVSDAGSGSGTLPGEDPPANTVLVAHDDDAPAVAVLLGDSPFLVTTANAVGDLDQLELTFDGGGTGTATVVSVGESVAYLASDDPSAAPVGFAQLGAPAAGDRVYALGDQVVSFAFGDPAPLGEAPDDAIAEGTPVVDDRGALVGLCTHGDGGWDVVAVAPLPESDGAAATSTTPSTSPTTSEGSEAEQPTAYLGVSLGLDDSGRVTVLSVAPGSPADLAGIIAGQRILALDGVPLASPPELVAAVRAHRPGDRIELTLSTSTAPVGSTVPSSSSPTSSATTAPKDTYAGVSTTTSTIAGTSTTTASTAVPGTTAPGTSGATTTVLAASTSSLPAASTSTQVTTTVAPATTSPKTTAPGYDLPTYTVTVVLGEHAPNV